MTATPSNALDIKSAGLVNFDGTSTFSAVTTTQYDVLVGAASNGISSIGPGSAGQILRSGGAAANPSYSTATYPATAGSSGHVLTSDGTNWISSAPSSGGITTIDGDSGSVTGSTITIEGATGGGAGQTVQFSGSGTVLKLNMVDANDNITIGRVAGNSGQSGHDNVGIGSGALQNLTNGGYNVGVGFIALNAITSGAYNVGIGYQSGAANQTANSNTSVGYQSLASATMQANTAIGFQALIGLTTGVLNCAIGNGAGSSYTGSESSNILILNTGVASESNVIRIGVNGSSSGEQDACYIAGITGATVTGTAVLCSAAGQLGTVSSSIRYKENVKDLSDEVSVMDLRPVEFNYKKDKERIRYGLIAEEVEKILPYLCFYNEKGDLESVQYHELPVLLLKEIQRLNGRIEKLESII